MRPPLGNASAFKYYYLISLLNSGDSMCNDNLGGTLHCLKLLLNLILRLHIKSRCRIIKYKHRSLLGYGSGYADTLLLPSRQTDTALAYYCLIFVSELTYKSGRPRRLCRGLDKLIRYTVFSPYTYIFLYGV